MAEPFFYGRRHTLRRQTVEYCGNLGGREPPGHRQLAGLYGFGVIEPVLTRLLPGKTRWVVSAPAVVGCQQTVFFEPILLLGERTALKQRPLPLRQCRRPVPKTPPQHRRHAGYERLVRHLALKWLLAIAQVATRRNQVAEQGVYLLHRRSLWIQGPCRREFKF